MVEVSFDNCMTLVECVNRYQYYCGIVNNKDKAALDWIFYAHVHDNLEDELWESSRGN